MLPKAIYELLPYLYVLTGLVAVIGVESILGKSCGFLLMIAGLVVHQTRSRYRGRKVKFGDLAGKKIPKRSNTDGEPVSQRRAKAQQDFENGEDSYEQGDHAAALKWYRKAADQGYAPAQINLGSMYAEGEGVPRDLQEALKWYHKAADQGDASAEFSLGMLYEQGEGVPQDFEEALRWYRKAADQGDALAQVNLGSMYAEGQGVPRDFQEALKWYRKAADQGYAPAQFNLAAIYAEGQEGIPQDLVMAYVWFSRSAMLGDEDAQLAQKQVGARLNSAQKMRAQQLLRTPLQEHPV
ncbi:MAG: tetratricopeptide repeat protein [Candidatus Contendobacter sp.]